MVSFEEIKQKFSYIKVLKIGIFTLDYSGILIYLCIIDIQNVSKERNMCIVVKLDYRYISARDRNFIISASFISSSNFPQSFLNETID